MKPSRVVWVIMFLALSVAVGWAQRGGSVGSFPRASVTSMGNFPAASATSMGHLPPWTFNNGFGFGNYNNGFGGFNNGAAGFNSGYGNYQTGFGGWNNNGAQSRYPRRGWGLNYGTYGWNPYYGGYGWGYYAYPVAPASDEVLGGSFYNDMNSRANGQFYSPDQQSPAESPEQPPVVLQQPAPAQPIVFIVDRDGNVRQYDSMQGKRQGATSAPQSEGISQVAQPETEDVRTILVYRDGHRQEITNYAIMGNKLYLSPHGTVSLSELDIPATISANDERGIDFRMPANNQ